MMNEAPDRITDGASLLAARLEAGVPRVEIAAAARVSESTISRIERGLVQPRRSTLHLLNLALERAGAQARGAGT
jgi:predicted transcriptional regulator